MCVCILHFKCMPAYEQHGYCPILSDESHTLIRSRLKKKESALMPFHASRVWESLFLSQAKRKLTIIWVNTATAWDLASRHDECFLTQCLGELNASGTLSLCTVCQTFKCEKTSRVSLGPDAVLHCFWLMTFYAQHTKVVQRPANVTFALVWCLDAV